MKFLLIFLHAFTVSGTVVCKKESKSKEDLKSYDAWAAKVKAELSKGGSASRNIHYGPTAIEWDENEEGADKKLFLERVNIVNKLSGSEQFTGLAACFVGKEAGGIVQASHLSHETLRTAFLAQQTGFHRAWFYMIMGRAYVSLDNVDAFASDLGLGNIRYYNDDLGTAYINVFHDVYPQRGYLRNIHTRLLANGQVPRDVNIKQYYPKLFFQNFIERSENRCQGFNMGQENLDPLPAEFSDLVSNMLTLNAELKDIVHEMNRLLKDIRLRTPRSRRGSGFGSPQNRRASMIDASRSRRMSVIN